MRQFKTLGELRADLSARLGFGSTGAAMGINQTLLNSFLQDAQYQLYWQFDWQYLTKYDETTTGAGQTLYDYAADCDPERLLSIAVWDGVRWVPMKEGITWDMRSVATTRFIPDRFERYSQMEIWPEPDTVYTIRRYYIQRLGRFTQDNDRATIDDGLVFLHAVTNAKQHYRQPDGQAYASQLQALMDKIKGKSRTSAVKRRGHAEAVTPLPRVV